MPAGLLGYEEGKREQLFEAGLDRQAFGVEKLREARVEELARMYPQVRIREIAASVVPWNYGIFKALAAVQIAKYKQELRSG